MKECGHNKFASEKKIKKKLIKKTQKTKGIQVYIYVKKQVTKLTAKQFFEALKTQKNTFYEKI